MNKVMPYEMPVRRFPTDVTSTIPDQYRGSSDSVSRDGSQKTNPRPTAPNKDAVRDEDKPQRE
jgi:hypothetical protein